MNLKLSQQYLLKSFSHNLSQILFPKKLQNIAGYLQIEPLKIQ